MAKLTFFYGEMGCGKTKKLLEDVEKATSEGKKFCVIKPSVDTKNGQRLLSRNGKSCAVDFLVEKNMDLFRFFEANRSVAGEKIFVDEAQFLAKEQIDQLLMVVTILDVSIDAYGLRLNFYLGDENFVGATRLLQVAHQLVCIESACDFCHHEQAIFSCVFVQGEIQTSGPSILIGDGTREIDAHALCARCYYKLISNKTRK